MELMEHLDKSKQNTGHETQEIKFSFPLDT